ncbi:DUF2805 domain-containing protein [Methylophilaceae bacterium]|nr:DUF2805 domain-containing protein [Methylophilaceae bacterium]
MSKVYSTFSEEDVSRIIEMAWEDRTPFEAILKNYGLDEPKLMRLMQANLKKNHHINFGEKGLKKNLLNI